MRRRTGSLRRDTGSSGTEERVDQRVAAEVGCEKKPSEWGKQTGGGRHGSVIYCLEEERKVCR